MANELEEIQSQIDEDYEPERVMRRPVFHFEPKKSTARNERQMWIEKTMEMLKCGFWTVNKETSGWPTMWIADYYTYCMKNGDPPARLWWGLIRKRKISTFPKDK